MNHEQYFQRLVKEEVELREWLAEQQDAIELLDEFIDLMASKGYHAVVERFDDDDDDANELTKLLASYVVNLQCHKIIRSSLLKYEGVDA